MLHAYSRLQFVTGVFHPILDYPEKNLDKSVIHVI